MAKLTRATQKLFGSSASAGQIAQFGSAAASGYSGGTTYSGATATPALVQNLAAWLSGWYSAVDGVYNPAIEDVNAVDWLYSYQLSYLFQEGIAEWDSGTTYFKGSVVNSATPTEGTIYVSIADTNLNHVVTDTTYWAPLVGARRVVNFNPAVSSPITLAAADSNKTFLVNSANGLSQFNLPNPSVVGRGWQITVTDMAGSLSSTVTLTFHRFSTEKFYNITADYVVIAPFWKGTIVTDGTDWFVVTG